MTISKCAVINHPLNLSKTAREMQVCEGIKLVVKICLNETSTLHAP